MRYIKTRAIVLQQVRYGETSLICRVFTRESGLLSLMIKGARSPRSVLKANRFQVMSLLDLVITDKPGASMQYVKEATLSPPFNHLPYDDWRRSTGIFLTEVLFRILQDAAIHDEMFDFAEKMLLSLDADNRPFHTFTHFMLLEYARLLGLYPLMKDEGEGYFYWGEGSFFLEPAVHAANWNESRLLERFVRACDSGVQIVLTNSERAILLDVLLSYLSWHIESLQSIRSLDILRELYRREE